MTTQSPPGPTQTRPSSSRERWLVGLALALAILLGGVMRFWNVDWDSGAHLHPDERFITMVATGIDWPDSVGEYFDSQNSPLNPYNRKFDTFVYGTSPLFLTKAIGDGLTWLMQANGWELFGHKDFNSYGTTHLLGRALSAVADLGTVLLVFLIARRLHGARVAALAALLMAFTVHSIQLSHFFAFDTFTVFAVTLTFYCLVRVMQGGGWGSYLAMGASFGLALSTKISIFWLPLAMAAAVGVWLYRHWQVIKECQLEPAARRQALRAALITIASGAVIAGSAALLVFRVLQPYAFDSSKLLGFWPAEHWLKDINTQRLFVEGQIDFPPSHQYAYTPAFLFPFKDIVVWGMGVPLGLAAWAGVVFATFQLIFRRRRRLEHLPLLVWIVFMFLYNGRLLAKGMRYFFPIYPMMVILAALLLVSAWSAATRRATSSEQRATGGGTRRRLIPLLGGGLVVVVLGFTFLYAVAYTRIYTETTTRVAASEWIYANVPAYTPLANEHWDDPIPLWLDAERRGDLYPGEMLNLYDEDNPRKRSEIEQTLNRIDYIFITSNRLYGSIPRLPMRYPLTTEYYKRLFAGDLGFDLVHTQAVYPNLFGLTLNDDRGMEVGGLRGLLQPDETFTVYDHPKVLIFKKRADYSPQRVHDILGAVPLDNVVQVLPKDAPNYKGQLTLTESQRAADEAGGTWSELFDPNSLTNRVPALTWWLLVGFLGLIAWVLTFRLFQRLADRGHGFAKALGVLLLAYAAWAPPALNLLPSTRWQIFGTLVLLTGLAGLAAWRQWPALSAFARARWRLLLLNEMVFLGLFLLFYAIRLLYPDLWHPFTGGEKPMDFAYLNATIKSTSFPPYDPWYAGGYINYYYFGQLIVATLTKLLGIVPTVAYNLAVPLFFALLGGAVFALVYNLAVRAPYGPLLFRRVAPHSAPPRPWAVERLPHASFDRRAVGIGLLAVALVAILGNLGEVFVFAQALGALSGQPFHSQIPGLEGLVNAIAGIGPWLQGKPLPVRIESWYWNPTRVIPETINEFPWFTFLYGDLHAHLMALPYTVLALGLALVAYRERGVLLRWPGGWPQALRPLGVGPGSMARTERVSSSEFSVLHSDNDEKPSPAQNAEFKIQNSLKVVDWGTLAVLVLLGWVIGALRPLNTWDYPTYLLLAAVVLIFQQVATQGGWRLRGLLWAAAEIAVVAGAGLALFYPYSRDYASFYNQILPWEGKKTLLSDYLIIHGLFLLILIPYLAHELFGRRGALPAGRWLTLAWRHRTRLRRLSHLSQRLVANQLWLNLQLALLAAIGFVAAGSALLGWGLGALLIPLLALTVLGLLAPRLSERRRLVLLLIGTGLALSLAVELVVVEGDIGRMNTVFKFYLQIWVLWGIASAVALSQLGRWQVNWRPGPRVLWRLGLIGLLACALLYPAAATTARLRDRFNPLPPTDDGMAYMDEAVWQSEGGPYELHWDAEAIRWLQANVAGSPVVLEGTGNLYTWAGRISIYTGLPTIIGWDWHQTQQRGPAVGDGIRQRIADVATLYNQPDSALARSLRQRYHVRYIVVGELERRAYSPIGLARLDSLAGQNQGLSLVYENPQVKIYQVSRS